MSAQTIYLLRQYRDRMGRVFDAKEFFDPSEFEPDVLADLIRLNYALPIDASVVNVPEFKEEPKKRKAGRPRKYETREMVSK